MLRCFYSVLSGLFIFSMLLFGCGGGSSSEVVAPTTSGTDPGPGPVPSSPKDTTAPATDISVVPPLSTTDADSILIMGTATDETGVFSVRVNGIPATALTPAFAQIVLWQVPDKLLSIGDNTLVVSTMDTLGNFNGNAASVKIRRRLIFSIPLRVAVDVANNRALVVDVLLNALIAVDLTTGDRSIFSDDSTGTGTNFFIMGAVAIDAVNNRALIVDSGLDSLIAVDLTTGNRSMISDATTGTRTKFSTVDAVAMDMTNNRILLINRIFLEHVIIAVDLTTGDRRVISDNNTGTGISFAFAQGIAVDVANNRALVTDGVLDALIAVDLTTGDRSIISDVTTGTGIEFSGLEGIAIDTANNRALVRDGFLNALIAVDLTSGNRSIISDNNTGTGNNFASPRQDIALDAQNNRVLMLNRFLSEDALIAVDLSTGNRTIVSDTTIGGG